MQHHFLEGIKTSAAASAAYPIYLRVALLERGRRAIGQRPADAGEALVLQLNRLIDLESDPDRRSRLEKLREFVVDIGKRTLAGAIVAAAAARL